MVTCQKTFWGEREDTGNHTPTFIHSWAFITYHLLKVPPLILEMIELYFMCMGAVPAYMSVHHMCAMPIEVSSHWTPGN